MITGIKLKAPVNNKRAHTILATTGISSLPIQIAKELESHLSKLTSKSGESLTNILHNKISFARPGRQRNKNWFGKIINKALKEDCSHIEINGLELLAMLKILDEKVDIDLHPEGNYLIPFEEAERMLITLNGLRS